MAEKARKERETPKCWGIKGTIYKSEKDLREHLAKEGKKLKTPKR